MSRKASETKARQSAAQLDARLRRELAELYVTTEDCYDDNCMCHEREWKLIRTLKFLLGERHSVE